LLYKHYARSISGTNEGARRRKALTDNTTDKIEQALDIMTEFADGLEALALGVKQRMAELVQVATVREETFDILNWQQKKGAKLSEFEIATKDNNDQEKYQHALNILKTNGATIEDRFHEPQYQHTYWTYQDTIYRQKRKEKP
jgi:urocanate hydratase